MLKKKSRFNQIKAEFKRAFREILSENDTYALKEAALPAYAHKNILIDFVFWRRLKIAYKRVGTNKKVLDFGTGTGIMAYLLAQSNDVVAIDIEKEPFEKLNKKLEFPNNINFIFDDVLNLDFPDNYFDVIVALDVLEHVSDLNHYMEKLYALLKSNGYMIISGPSENILYSLGRKIAGKSFSGEYHTRNINTIISKLKINYKVYKKTNLFWLFKVFNARR